MKLDLNFKNLDLPSVKIVKTTPKVSSEQLFSYDRCYFGISLDNPHFSGKSLQALLLWGIGNFDRCLVVIGDYLKRYNEKILKGLEDDEAIETALKLGDNFMKRTEDFFQQLPGRRVTLIRWKNCLETDEYKNASAILKNLFTLDQNFKESVEKDAFSFVRRQLKHNKKLAIPTEEAITLSSQYLLEEIAVFGSLSKRGWKVELYPGPELNVLVDIAKGRYSGIPEGLKERVNVELKIRESKANKI